ncbi:uncharacterized protein BT62DRAFT_1028227, partial [Guyanagaster necrorhizus]
MLGQVGPSLSDRGRLRSSHETCNQTRTALLDFGGGGNDGTIPSGRFPALLGERTECTERYIRHGFENPTTQECGHRSEDPVRDDINCAPLMDAPCDFPTMQDEVPNYGSASVTLECVPEHHILITEGNEFDDPAHYSRHVRLYTLLVPVATLCAFALSLIPLLVLPLPKNNQHSELPFPVPEILISVALCSVSYHLPESTDILFWATVRSGLIFIAPTLLGVLHQADYAIPTIRDPAFVRVWVVGLAWAATDAFVGIRSAYRSFSLYSPLEEREQEELLSRQEEDGSSSVSTSFSLLSHLRARAELEEAIGEPFIEIPLFVFVLQRVGSLLFSLGTALFLTASLYSYAPHPTSVLVWWWTFPLVIVLQAAAQGFQRPHVKVYVGMVIGLGIFFAGLGVWGALE